LGAPYSIRELEYHLLNLLAHQLSRSDDTKMAVEWCKHVDVVPIFPKLPVYLSGYHKEWLRNQRIQDAVKNMKSEIELLEAMNKRQTPAEISPPIGISGIMAEGDDLGAYLQTIMWRKMVYGHLLDRGQPFLP
jgi:hypothetical protein